MAKKKSPIKELVKESIQELKEQEFPVDPSLEQSEELEGPERFAHTQRRRDEVVIDELLADISTKEGYFVKLKKEIRPNEWMLMKVIESEWRRWADIETAVADIVREYTKKSPQKWGTGTYRVEIACRGGFRGKRYEPIDVPVNADEEFVNAPLNNSSLNSASDSAVQVATQIDTLAQLVNVIRGVVPQGPDPNTIQTTVANAFQQGLQLKANESQNMTTLIVGMMTAMMTAMKDIAIANRSSENNTIKTINPEESLAKMLDVMSKFGVIGQKSEKSAIDFAKELQALGLDLFKKDEPLEQINKLKQIASIASDFMGMSGTGERPSILEKLVDILGPAVPEMIKNVKDTFNQAVTAQQIAQQNIDKMKELRSLNGKQPLPSPSQDKITTYQQMNGNANNSMNEQIKQFFNNLYESVRTNNKMFYPIVYTSLLQDQNGMALVQGIAQGSKTAKDVIETIQQFGDERFKQSEFVVKQLVPYVNGFIIWIQQMVEHASPTPSAPNTNQEFDVECPQCHAIYSYPSEKEFIEEQNKICGTNNCQGILQPLMKA